MRTVLHVGQSKAGWTALQDCLLRSRDLLLEKSVLYPTNVNGVGWNNHRLLSQPLRAFEAQTGDVGREVSGPEHLATMYTEFMHHLREQITEYRPECFVLSYESLFDTTAIDKGPVLKHELEGLGARTVDVAIYIRRPSPRYLSRVQQALKTRMKLSQPSEAKYKGPFACFSQTFGRDALRPRLFEREQLANRSITHDFAHEFLSEQGVDPDALISPQRVNESLSAPSMLLLDRYRAAVDAGDAPDFSLKDLRLALMRIERDVTLPKARLQPEIAEMMDYCSDEPLWLRETWGLTFPDFDYERLKKRRFASLRAIDRLEDIVVVADAYDGLPQLVDEMEARLPDSAIASWARGNTRGGRSRTRWLIPQLPRLRR